MKFSPINPKCSHFLHGGDYNPEQWLDEPGILQEDMRLMELAKCNAMSVGIFAWTNLEPEEGRFEFGWLDDVMDRLAEKGAYAVLATPSGAKPAWMSAKYPEILRVNWNREKQLHGGRHNHCMTSPVYRQKTSLINQKLAERYKDHPALLVWHISNEYGGECHCALCQEAFRNWLKQKYDGDLERLNHAWWTRFWSHTFTDWSQIESPSPLGENELHGLKLDWKRFVTFQTLEFMKNEIAPLRKITPGTPITTNFMRTYGGLDYWKLVDELDVISWDSYPPWHGETADWITASDAAFMHDICRSMKGGKPFMLMESTPSMTNWQEVLKLKRPGMHLLSSLQAVAHGSDTVQYFQWRKSRGSFEKLHGAVVGHCGHENTRVFRDVAGVGEVLQKLDSVVGTTIKPEAAILFDWENRWALEDAKGLHNIRKEYEETCKKHYQAFWRRGVPVDVINMDCSFDGYKLLVAPMLYMVKPGVAERIEKFVEKGGTFVGTYASGIVDENDLCFLGGFPGPLRKLLGIWAEEIDSLYDQDINYVRTVGDNSLKLAAEYEARVLCELVHAESAQILAEYRTDFYAGRPALTVNRLGLGKAYYIAFRNNKDFEDDFYGALIEDLHILKAMDAELPEGVTAQLRTDGQSDFVFVMNFTTEGKTVPVKEDTVFRDMLTDGKVQGKIELPAYGIAILERK